MIHTERDVVLSDEQKSNLHALAIYLLRQETTAVSFSMTHYYYEEGQVISPVPASQQSTEARQHSHACALGQALFVPGIPGPDKHTKSWGKYGTERFGIEPYTIAWDYLFSGHWAAVDDTAEGAALRILYFLKHCADLPRRAHFGVLGYIEYQPAVYRQLQTLKQHNARR